MSVAAPPGTVGALGILVIVEPAPVAPIDVLLRDKNVPPSKALLLSHRDRPVLQTGPSSPISALWLHTTVPAEPADNALPHTPCPQTLAACRAYPHWMDNKRRQSVDTAILTGMGALMVVADTVLSAAEIGRHVRRKVDIAIQIHEVSAIWTSLSTMPII